MFKFLKEVLFSGALKMIMISRTIMKRFSILKDPYSQYNEPYTVIYVLDMKRIL